MKEKVFKWNGVSGYYLLDAERYNTDKRLYSDNFRPRYTDYQLYLFETSQEREEFLRQYADRVELVSVIYW